MRFTCCELNFACGIGALAVMECGGGVVSAMRDYRVGAKTVYTRAMHRLGIQNINFQRPPTGPLDLVLATSRAKVPASAQTNLFPRYFITTQDSEHLQTYFLSRKLQCNALKFGVPQARNCHIWVGINRTLNPCDADLDAIEARFTDAQNIHGSHSLTAGSVLPDVRSYYARPKNTKLRKAVHSTRLPAPDLSETRWWVPFPDVYMPTMEDSVGVNQDGTLALDELRSLSVPEVLLFQGLPKKFHELYSGTENDFKYLLTDQLPFPVILAILNAIDFEELMWPIDTPVRNAVPMHMVSNIRKNQRTTKTFPWRYDVMKNIGGKIDQRNGIMTVTYIVGSSRKGDEAVSKMCDFQVPDGWKVQIRKRRNDMWDDIYWMSPRGKRTWIRTQSEAQREVEAYLKWLRDENSKPAPLPKIKLVDDFDEEDTLQEAAG